MENKVKDRLHKKDILTIPNLLSFFRILLIPAIVVLYSYYKKHIAAVAVITLSGITDIADGKIARKYNMVSDFGKFLDPLADKLTQAAMILCLLAQYPAMLALIIFMALKECLVFLFNYIAFKKTGIVNGARWYGKATTVLIYVVMVVLFLFPSAPLSLANVLIALLGAAIFLSMVMYFRLFYTTIKTHGKEAQA